MPKIEGHDRVVEPDRHVGESQGVVLGRRRRQPFQVMAEIIGEITRRPALERGGARQAPLAVPGQLLAQGFERVAPETSPIQGNLAVLGHQGAEGIGGDEGIAPGLGVLQGGVEK